MDHVIKINGAFPILALTLNLLLSACGTLSVSSHRGVGLCTQQTIEVKNVDSPVDLALEISAKGRKQATWTAKWNIQNDSGGDESGVFFYDSDSQTIDYTFPGRGISSYSFRLLRGRKVVGQSKEIPVVPAECYPEAPRAVLSLR